MAGRTEKQRAGLDLRRRLLFARSMLANPRTVGAVWPTSRRAVSDLLDMWDIPSARTILEFGVGTGVYTDGILDRMPSEARLFAFEVDREMANAVREKLPDPRLTVVPESAERAGERLGGEKADVVVSSLPFTTLPSGTGDVILDLIPTILAPDGAFLVLQYSKNIQPKLESRFGRVERKFSPFNVPPAILYRCIEPGA